MSTEEDKFIDKVFIENENLRSKLTEARAEIAEQCRLNTMGQERELKLLAEIERLKFHDKLSAADWGAQEDEIQSRDAEIERLEKVLEEQAFTNYSLRRLKHYQEEIKSREALLEKCERSLERAQEWMTANHEMPLYSELIHDTEVMLAEIRGIKK